MRDCVRLYASSMRDCVCMCACVCVCVDLCADVLSDVHLSGGIPGPPLLDCVDWSLALSPRQLLRLV